MHNFKELKVWKMSIELSKIILVSSSKTDLRILKNVFVK